MRAFTFPSTLPRWVVVAMVVVLGSIYGLMMVCAHVGGKSIPPLAYNFGFHFGACVGIIGAVRLQGGALRFTREMVPYLVLGSLLANVVPSLSLILAAPRLPVGVVAVLLTLAPLVTCFLSLVIGIERFAMRRVAGVMLGLAGTLLIVLPRTSLPSPDMLAWVMVGLVLPLGFGAGAVFNKLKRPAGIDSWTNAAMFNAVGAIVLFPLMLAADQVPAPATLPREALMAISVAIACGVFTQFLLLEILRLAGPVMMSQVWYVVTAAGLAWGWLLFGEQPSTWLWAASAIILAGVALVVRPVRERAGPVPPP